MKMTSKKQNNRLPASTVAIIVIVCIALVGVFASCIITISKGNIVPIDGSYITTVPEETEPPVPFIEKTVTVGSSGDVILHKPVFEAAYSADSGEYDFNDIFTGK